jgi:hypothetical protein
LLYNQTMNDNRHSQRQPVMKKRDCALGLFSFKHLDWTDHQASIVDIGNGGVGIELDTPPEPGIVWFRDRIFGQHSGVLLWSKQVGSQYRSGIRFVPLSHDVENFIEKKITGSRQREPLKDLQKIVAMQIDSIKASPV